MSKIKMLTRQGFAPFVRRVTETQQYLGGGIGSIRHGSVNDACYYKGDDEEKMDLKCKVAFVTGGASGIGFAIANELLNEGLYRVIIGDLEPCKGLRAATTLSDKHGENKCCYVPLNVACIKQLEEVMKKIQASYNNLDILINNVGQVTEDIDLEIDTNLRPVIHGTEIGFKLMRSQKNKGGVIINIGDTKGLSACKHFPIYASEKSGVHKYSMGVGRISLSKSNVRVVAVAPGLTESEMGEKLKNKPDPACLQQRASAVGKAVAYTARYADSGSLWVVENRKLLKAKWPNKNCYLEMITTL